MKYYWTITKKEIVSFATKCMDLKNIILSDVSQRNTNTILCPLNVQSKNGKKKKEKPHRYTEKHGGCQRWGCKMGERGQKAQTTSSTLNKLCRLI